VGWRASRSAATQFFIYTMAGSAALLVAFLAVFFHRRMDFLTSTLPPPPANSNTGQAHLGPVTLWLAIGVLAGLPSGADDSFHTWLPAAYAEAPSPVTMLLTGAMSKMASTACCALRFPLCHQIAQIRTPLLVLAWLPSLWAHGPRGAEDLKRVFAYMSVNHLGYCLLASSRLRFRQPEQLQRKSGGGAHGVIFQMFNHGITAAALFWLWHDQERTAVIAHRSIWRLRKPRRCWQG